MKLVLLLILLNFSISVQANHFCQKNIIFCQMISNLMVVYKNQKFIEKNYNVKELYDISNSIYKYTKQLDLSEEKLLFTDILMRESYYKKDAVNCVKGTFENNEIPELLIYLVEDFKEISDCRDFGISQINYKTALELYNFNLDRILKDSDYGVFCGAKVFSDIKKNSKMEKDWWTLYNASSKNLKARALYKRNILEWQEKRKLLKLEKKFWMNIEKKLIN